MGPTRCRPYIKHKHGFSFLCVAFPFEKCQKYQTSITVNTDCTFQIIILFSVQNRSSKSNMDALKRNCAPWLMVVPNLVPNFLFASCFNSVRFQGSRAWSAFLLDIWIVFWPIHRSLLWLIRLIVPLHNRWSDYPLDCWGHQLQQDVQVLKQQNRPRPSHYYQHIKNKTIKYIVTVIFYI